MSRFIINCYSCANTIVGNTTTYKIASTTQNIQYTICKQCYSQSLTNNSREHTTKLLTEDDGKMFEMAICLALGISYDGKYKYGMDIPHILQCRLEPLKSRFVDYAHSAKSGARYDYTSVSDPTKHISAKTTKKGNGKVAPQVVGQAQPQKFCDVIGIVYTGVPELKKYIQENIATILPVLFSYTFDCPMLYYNVEKNTIRLLEYMNIGSPIDWTAFTYCWTCDWSVWNNSSCVKIAVGEKTVSIMEFQFHTKSRTNMAVRWCFEELLSVFGEHFTIESL